MPAPLLRRASPLPEKSSLKLPLLFLLSLSFLSPLQEKQEIHEEQENQESHNLTGIKKDTREGISSYAQQQKHPSHREATGVDIKPYCVYFDNHGVGISSISKSSLENSTPIKPAAKLATAYGSK